MIPVPAPPLPDLSVAIASFSGVGALSRCLASLTSQGCAMQIVVATTARPESCRQLAECYSQVQWIHAPSESNVFRLRSLALAEAHGRVVALTEDHFTFSREWAAAVMRAATGATFILGGPIANGLPGRAFDWALYLVEYSAFLPPMEAGPVDHVSAANVVYPRAALQECQLVWADEFHDPSVHAALRQLGCHCQIAPKAEVQSHLNFSLCAAMGHLFGGGLWFGSYRVAHASWVARVIWSCSAPIIPILLMGRIVQRVITKRPLRLVAFLSCSFYTLLLVMSWSVGEALGYWRSLISSRHR